MRAIGSVPLSCDILTPPSAFVAFAHACRPATAWRPWRAYLPDVEMLAPNRIASGICIYEAVVARAVALAADQQGDAAQVRVDDVVLLAGASTCWEVFTLALWPSPTQL